MKDDDALTKRDDSSKDLVRFCQDHSLDACALDNAIAELMKDYRVEVDASGRPYWTKRGRRFWTSRILKSETLQVVAYAVLIACTMKKMKWYLNSPDERNRINEDIERLFGEDSAASDRRAIVVEIEDGICQQVYGDFDDLIIVDHDSLEMGHRLNPEEAAIARRLGCQIDEDHVGE